MCRSRETVAKRKFLVKIVGSIDLEEASHETMILEAFSLKSVGSIARNARFGSTVFYEISRKPRAK